MKTYEEKAYSALRRIEEELEKRENRKRVIRRKAAPIAVFCLMVIAVAGIWSVTSIWSAADGTGKKSNLFDRWHGSEIGVPGDVAPFGTQQAGNSTSHGTQQAGSSASGQAGTDKGVDSSSAAAAKTEYLVYTDPIILPENISESDLVVDMLGCLVYKGSVYVQAECFYDPGDIERFRGEYVGEAKGTLGEWSTQEDYAVEFASNYSGPVYKVKGYSEDFRLCVCLETKEYHWIQFLDNYDGIGLNTGADLFEKRLHVLGNVDDVNYQTPYDWKVGDGRNYQELADVTKEQFEAFLQELCDSPFERIDPKAQRDFYENKMQGHIILYMKDGTRVELRLFEGGYVKCCGDFSPVFVKMPGELFDKVLAACQ